MTNEQRYRLNRLADQLVTERRFGREFDFPAPGVTDESSVWARALAEGLHFVHRRHRPDAAPMYFDPALMRIVSDNERTDR